MGLLNAMFGGGTKLELFLDNTTSSPGAVLGGRVVLHGGKKNYPVKEVAVRLMFVHTQAKAGQTLPEIDMREVAKQVVAANGQLAAGSQQQYSFRLTVPHDEELSAHNVAYQVVATADIPGIKDPQDSAKVKVVEADEDENRRLPVEEVLERFPGLRSADEEELCDALRDLFLACYSEGASLMEIEPFLRQRIETGTVKVRQQALEAWANLVDGRVQQQHLQTLYAVANRPGLDAKTFEQVVIAATKFAEEGALPLVQQLARHPEVRVREQVASNLRFNAADRFEGKRELLIQLAQDPSAEVRKAAVSGFSDFHDDPELMNWVATLADQDPSPEVQGECMSTLALAHHEGMGELTLRVYEKHAASNPHSVVRQQIAGNLSWQPPEAAQRIYAIAQRLAADPDEEVRSRLAFEFVNMEKHPSLLPIAQHMSQNDASEEVRRRATEGLTGLLQPDQAASFYGSLLAQARSEDQLWTIVNGLRKHNEHPQVQQLLTNIGQCSYPDVANAARDALS